MAITDPIDKAGLRPAVRALGDGSYADVVIAASVGVGAATDRSGSITTGGTAQDLAAANTERRSLTGQNISTADLWINETGGTAAADTAGSYRVVAGATFRISTTAKVSVVGATTGQKFSATET